MDFELRLQTCKAYNPRKQQHVGQEAPFTLHEDGMGVSNEKHVENLLWPS